MSRCDEYEFGDDELYEHYVTQAGAENRIFDQISKF